MPDIFDRQRQPNMLNVCPSVARFAEEMQRKLDMRASKGDDFSLVPTASLWTMLSNELDEFWWSKFAMDEAADVANYAMFLSWLSERRKYADSAEP